MSEVSQDLLNELLRRMHQRFDKIDHAISELRNDNVAIRNQLHTVQGDVNSVRASMAHIETRLDRIETRLDLRELSEAQARFEPKP